MAKKMHRHYPCQILFCPQAKATTQLGNGRILEGRVTLIDSNESHLCEFEGESLSLFFEPESREGRFLNKLYFHGSTVMDISHDPSIESLLCDILSWEIISLDQALELRSRLVYLLWQRLLLAIEQISKGKSLGFAAHEAGFSDSAHFSRTFHETFGKTADQIFSKGTFIQVSFMNSSYLP